MHTPSLVEKYMYAPFQSTNVLLGNTRSSYMNDFSKIQLLSQVTCKRNIPTYKYGIKLFLTLSVDTIVSHASAHSWVSAHVPNFKGSI